MKERKMIIKVGVEKKERKKQRKKVDYPRKESKKN